jgi:hypothetical protein
MPSWPTLTATENILPFSVVKIATGAGNNKVSICTGNPSSVDVEYICGVTAGTLSPNSNQFHALAGEQVTLQEGRMVMVRASTFLDANSARDFSAIRRGMYLFPMPNGNGQVNPKPWTMTPFGNPPTAANFKLVSLVAITEEAFENPQTGDLYDSSYSVIFPAMVVMKEHNTWAV